MFRTLAAASRRTRTSTPRSRWSPRWPAGSASASAASLPMADGRFATICKEGPCVPPTAIDWARFDAMSVDLSTAVGRLRLKNPIATASGTFGYGLEFADYLDLSSLGAISVKGLSLPAVPRQPAPAHLRDGRRHAERDRPAERGRRRLSRREAARARPARRDRDRERVGRHRGRLRGGRGADRRRAPDRRDRGERLLPERRQGRHGLRQQPRGARRPREANPRGDDAIRSS